MTTTTIVSVIEREPNGRRWFLIQDAEGVKYATDNPLMASLADRCRVQGTAVTISAGNGWYYKRLRTIEPVGKDAVA